MAQFAQVDSRSGLGLWHDCCGRERLGQAVAVWALLTVHRSQGKEAAARSQPFFWFY